MKKEKEYYFKNLTCNHCLNVSKMEIIGSVHHEMYANEPEISFEGGNTYSVLTCPNCSKINVVYYYWDDGFDEDSDQVEVKCLYPNDAAIPQGLPGPILSSYLEAEKAKQISPAFYAFGVRKLMEEVCLEQGAIGKDLHEMLKLLSTEGKFPPVLAEIGHLLRSFGNIGTHENTKKLTKNEQLIINDLCSAILEYLYSAPKMAEIARIRLETLKKKKQ